MSRVLSCMLAIVLCFITVGCMTQDKVLDNKETQLSMEQQNQVIFELQKRIEILEKENTKLMEDATVANARWYQNI